MAPWSLGSDTGGSIRLPASFCGTAGLKPTYGRVSRYGLVAYGSSLDQIGPIAKNAADAAILLDIISGRDLRDSTSVDSEKMDLKKIFSSGDRQDLKGWKIGLPQEYFSEKIHPEVRAVNEYCAAKFKGHGAELVPVNLSYTDYAVPVYYLIATAEASSNLARYDGVRYGVRSREAANIAEVYAKSRHHGFGKEVKRRILLGTYVLSAGYYDAYYRKASKVRTLIRDEFLKVFQEVDLLLAPVSPSTAFRVGEKMTDPIEMYLSDILTISANLAGIPAMSVNGGFSREGLPVGVQLLGSYFQEEKILSAALFLERFIEKRKPDLLAEHDSE
jgi:aspartyl-tRNA(Asn)/glutamyl-tRNA(Gln) amidotransferase subunit A